VASASSTNRGIASAAKEERSMSIAAQKSKPSTHREPTPPLPTRLRTVRLILDVDADTFKLLAWAAQGATQEVADYCLDLLCDHSNDIMDWPVARRAASRPARRRA
jgi:hypothetical protein